MKSSPLRQPGFLLSTIALALLVTFQLSDQRAIPAGASSSDAALREIQTFVEAYRIVQADFVDTSKLEPNALIVGAIRGMLATLEDQHTRYLPVQDARQLVDNTQGEFGGIGIHIGTEEGRPAVIAPLEGSPAWRAGVEAGDLIMRIDGKSTDGMELDDAVAILRGQVGTDVEIHVARRGVAELIPIRMTREIIRLQSVKHTDFQGMGYIRISDFSERTSEELDEAIQNLEGRRVRGLILDLRGNPGGVLTGAIAVANRFLETGVIVSTIGRDPRQTQYFRASPAGIHTRLPLVVLVDNGSASASEIVAGAVLDHRRGVLIGTRTYGKGSVQTVENLPDGSKIALTTARYFTPSGRSIHKIGITPDTAMIVEALPISDSDQAALLSLRDTNVIREFARGMRSYTPADIDRLEELVAQAGLVMTRQTLERRLVVELSRRNDNRIFLVPHLDPPLSRALDVLRGSTPLAVP